MAKDNSDYDAYVAEVESTLTTDQEKEAFKVLTSGAVGKTVFGGHLREKEFYRRLNAMHDEKEDLTKREQEWQQWYQDNAPKTERLAAERDALKAQLDKMKETIGLDDDGSTRPEVSKVEVDDSVKKEIARLQTQVAFFDKALPQLLKDMGQINNKIVKENWDVDAGAVLDHALSKSVDLHTAFKELTADEADKRAKTREEQLIAKAKEEGRREALKQVPSPDHLRPSGPTIVDSLRGTPKPTSTQDRISGAVSEWVESGGAAASAGSVL